MKNDSFMALCLQVQSIILSGAGLATFRSVATPPQPGKGASDGAAFIFAPQFIDKFSPGCIQSNGVQMPYSNRGNPVVGDRVRHQTGRFGIVTEVRPNNRYIGFGELAIKWDDGVVGNHYAFVNEFTLLSRSYGKLGKISRNRLADLLRDRQVPATPIAPNRSASIASRKR